MKTFKFLELSGKARDKAIQDYIDGWQETHPLPEDQIDYDEIYDILSIDCDHDLYNEDGTLIGDE